MSKSLNNGTKSFLNSGPLSNITRTGLGYRDNQTWLNIWLIRADVLSIYSVLFALTSSILNKGTCAISNHPVAGSTKVIHVNCRFTTLIEPSGCRCFTDLVYGPIRSICTVFHGSRSWIYLGGDVHTGLFAFEDLAILARLSKYT